MASRCDAAGEEQSELISFMRQLAKPNKTQILLSTARYNISFVLQTERHSHGSSSHAAEGAFYPGEKGVESAYQSVPPVYISFPRHIHSSPNAQDTCITTLLLCQPAHLTSTTSITFHPNTATKRSRMRRRHPLPTHLSVMVYPLLLLLKTSVATTTTIPQPVSHPPLNHPPNPTLLLTKTNIKTNQKQSPTAIPKSHSKALKSPLVITTTTLLLCLFLGLMTYSIWRMLRRILRDKARRERRRRRRILDGYDDDEGQCQPLLRRMNSPLVVVTDHDVEEQRYHGML